MEAAEASAPTPAPDHQDVAELAEFYRYVFPTKPVPTDQNIRDMLELAVREDVELLLLFVWDIDKHQKAVGNPLPYAKAILKRGPNWDVVRDTARRVRAQVEQARESAKRDMEVEDTLDGLASVAPAEMTDETREKIISFAEKLSQRGGVQPATE